MHLAKPEDQFEQTDPSPVKSSVIGSVPLPAIERSKFGSLGLHLDGCFLSGIAYSRIVVVTEQGAQDVSLDDSPSDVLNRSQVLQLGNVCRLRKFRGRAIREAGFVHISTKRFRQSGKPCDRGLGR